MEQKQSLYDMDHPFYYNPHTESKMGEGNDKSIEEAVKQHLDYLSKLIDKYKDALSTIEPSISIGSNMVIRISA